MREAILRCERAWRSGTPTGRTEGRAGQGLQKAAANTLLQGRFVEVHQQPHFQPTQTKISEQLCLMHRQNLLHSLNFDDQDLFNDHIDVQIAFDRMALINDRQPPLSDEFHSSLGKFEAQAGFIYGLQQTGTERPMHFDRTTNHTAGQFVIRFQNFAVPLCLCGEPDRR
jgi:hypothetical protein